MAPLVRELSERDYLASIWASLRRLEAKEATYPELPPVVVDPPDLTDIVTAVNGLKPGATAEDIALAIKDVLQPHSGLSEDATDVLRQVAQSLENLDFRLKGVGVQAYGGGSVNFTPQALEQLAAAIGGGSSSGLTIMQPATWWETAEGTNTQLTITRPAVADQCHNLTAWSADYGSTMTGKSLVISAGATPIVRRYIHNTQEMAYARPIQIPVNTAVSITLEAGGAAVLSRLNLQGYTAEPV